MQNTLRLIAIFLVTAALSTATSSSIHAQSGLTTEGREFWFGFMPNYVDHADALRLFVASAVTNEVVVEMFDESGKVATRKVLTLGPHSTRSLPLSNVLETRELETPVFRAIRVTADLPISCYGYSENALTTGAFQAIPLATLGTEYYCVSYYDDAYSPGVDHLGGEFLVVAPYDGTQITITTTAHTSLTEDGKTIGHTAGSTWSVNLKRGQTYLVQSTGWEWGVGDLTGSRVISNKPVALLSGHQRAAIGLDAGTSKDHLVEMLPPVEYWGTEYVGVPQVGRTTVGNLYRVISAEDGNSIRTSYRDSVFTLDAGQYAELSLVVDPTHFISQNSKKFLVVEYAYVGGYNGDPGIGDPFLAVLTPVSNFTTQALFRNTTGTNGAFRHYASFVSRDPSLGQVTITKGNSTPQSISAFGVTTKQLGSTPYTVGTVTLSGDEVAWLAESPVPFGMTIYGVSNVEAFGYSGSRTFSNASDTLAPVAFQIARDSCGAYEFKVHDRYGLADVFPLIANDNYSVSIDSSFEVGDTITRVYARVIDPGKDAALAIFAVDRSGNNTIFSGSYVGRPFAMYPLEHLPFTRVGDTSCVQVRLRNLHTGTQRFELSPPSNHSVYRLSQSSEILLGPGDSIDVELCFAPDDSLRYLDSIIASNECHRMVSYLDARGGFIRIYADDHYFGNIAHGSQQSANVEISNTGSVGLTVVGYTLTGDSVFEILGVPLPLYISSEWDAEVLIRFTPSRDSGDYSARIDWLLDAETTGPKPFTVLTGISRGSLAVSEHSSSLRTWPNPASSRLHVELEVNTPPVSVKVTDVLGSDRELPVVSTSDGFTADVSSLATGVYLLQISTAKTVYLKQLVIKR